MKAETHYVLIAEFQDTGRARLAQKGLDLDRHEAARIRELDPLSSDSGGGLRVAGALFGLGAGLVAASVVILTVEMDPDLSLTLGIALAVLGLALGTLSGGWIRLMAWRHEQGLSLLPLRLPDCVLEIDTENATRAQELRGWLARKGQSEALSIQRSEG